MMTSAQCSARATELEHTAAAITAPSIKAQYLETAAQWRGLATQALFQKAWTWDHPELLISN